MNQITKLSPSGIPGIPYDFTSVITINNALKFIAGGSEQLRIDLKGIKPAGLSTGQNVGTGANGYLISMPAVPAFSITPGMIIKSGTDSASCVASLMTEDSLGITLEKYTANSAPVSLFSKNSNPAGSSVLSSINSAGTRLDLIQYGSNFNIDYLPGYPYASLSVLLSTSPVALVIDTAGVNIPIVMSVAETKIASIDNVGVKIAPTKQLWLDESGDYAIKVDSVTISVTGLIVKAPVVQFTALGGAGYVKSSSLGVISSQVGVPVADLTNDSASPFSFGSTGNYQMMIDSVFTTPRFQAVTGNVQGRIVVAPKGSSAAADILFLTEESFSAGPYGLVGMDGTAGMSIRAGRAGAGAFLPIKLSTSDTVRVTIGVAGGVLFSGGIGIYGNSVAAQTAHVADPSGGVVVDSQARTAINAILLTLENFGFHANA
jgi:hypothetical protein